MEPRQGLVSPPPYEIALDKAIVVRSASGEIRRLESQISLDCASKTMVQIKKPWRDRPGIWTPSAVGYRKLASKCGVVLDPNLTEVTVDGKGVRNPCWSKDGKTCYSRSRAGGFTSNGQPFIIDRTVEFSIERYNIQDLLAKAKSSECSKYFKVLPFCGRDDHGVLLGEPKEGSHRWGGYQLDDVMVLWVRTTDNPEFFKWYTEMNNRTKNALRTVQTFSDRNAMAAHPAMPTGLHFDKPASVLKCVSWFAIDGQMSFDMIAGQNNVEVLTAHEVVGETDEETGAPSMSVAGELEATAEDVGDVPEHETVDGVIVEPVEVEAPVPEPEPEPVPDDVLSQLRERMAGAPLGPIRRAHRAVGVTVGSELSTLDSATIKELFVELEKELAS